MMDFILQAEASTIDARPCHTFHCQSPFFDGHQELREKDRLIFGSMVHIR